MISRIADLTGIPKVSAFKVGALLAKKAMAISANNINPEIGNERANATKNRTPPNVKKAKRPVSDMAGSGS
jgi:hypothetical protein